MEKIEPSQNIDPNVLSLISSTFNYLVHWLWCLVIQRIFKKIFIMSLVLFHSAGACWLFPASSDNFCFLKRKDFYGNNMQNLHCLWTCWCSSAFFFLFNKPHKKMNKYYGGQGGWLAHVAPRRVCSALVHDLMWQKECVWSCHVLSSGRSMTQGNEIKHVLDTQTVSVDIINSI